ncbi:uncharacterized protein LOC135401389 [Ornithodoros turicata]|uniref:uncharacterized protein LOC135401389 n=1 Tax=Ornithodoros turicata TaxID=34597 RepID=UPI00313A07C1
MDIDEAIYCTSEIIKYSQKSGIDKITTKYDTVGSLAKDLDDTGRLGEYEVDQVEACFKSHKTFVYACRCLANLYMTNVDSSGHPDKWDLARTGVPVLILDKGETRARTRRMVHIVLAERGTGFALWKDIIDNLSSYQKPAVTFHTMHLSSDHRRMAGLSFDVADAAQEFWDKVEELTSDPLNISLSVPKSNQKGLKKRKSKDDKRKSLPRKSDISLPCCFQHVTSVGSSDKERFYSLSMLGPETEID